MYSADLVYEANFRHFALLLELFVATIVCVCGTNFLKYRVAECLEPPKPKCLCHLRGPDNGCVVAVKRRYLYAELERRVLEQPIATLTDFTDFTDCGLHLREC